MAKIWTHAGVSEAQERETPNTPIHYDKNYNTDQAERRWKRFVFFDNLTDGVVIGAAVVGLACLLFMVFADLAAQHGVLVYVSLGGVALAVLIFNKKK